METLRAVSADGPLFASVAAVSSDVHAVVTWGPTMPSELARKIEEGCDVWVPINSEVDVIVARQKGRLLASQLNFSTADLALIATSISELAQNIISYAGHGEISLWAVHEKASSGVVIVARDEGPGIEDLARAVRDGYSTSGGLGLGLSGVRRLMDEFDIESLPGAGTTVRVVKWHR